MRNLAADSTANSFFSFWGGRLGPLGPGPPRMKKKECSWISCIIVSMKTTLQLNQLHYSIWPCIFCILVEDLDKACPRKLFGVRTPNGWSHFGSPDRFKNTNRLVYPFAKEVSPKINELQAITFYDGRASDAQSHAAPPKRQFLEIKKLASKFSFRFTQKFQTAVYPPRMARIGTKFWENTFQTICNF